VRRKEAQAGAAFKIFKREYSARDSSGRFSFAFAKPFPKFPG
jgi:hypothetical protein